MDIFRYYHHSPCFFLCFFFGFRFHVFGWAARWRLSSSWFIWRCNLKNRKVQRHWQFFCCLGSILKIFLKTNVSMNLSTTDYEMIWVDFWLNLISVSIFESNLFSTPGQYIRWVWCSNGSYFCETQSGQNTIAKSNEPLCCRNVLYLPHSNLTETRVISDQWLDITGYL